MMARSSVSASAKGATFLILVQVGSRAATFLVNQALLRYISPDLLGASFQFELYTLSVIYFARESLRVAIQRQPESVQGLVNIALTPAILGIPLAAGLGLLFLYSGLPPGPDSVQSLRLYGMATIMELLSEPCFALVQHQLAYSIRAAAETVGSLMRCAVCLGIVLWKSSADRSQGTIAFASGQLAFALTSLTVFVWKTMPLARQCGVTLSPKTIEANSMNRPILGLFPRQTCTLTLSLYLQNTVKYVLTQGDALILTSVVSLYDQGAYALASNYGGLVARMVFQPIEESSRNLFSKLCAIAAGKDRADPSLVRDAVEVLSTLLKAYNIMAVAAWAIGPSIAPQLLDIVGGARWGATGAGQVLAAFCYYIPLLAINGVTEAFVAAVASTAELHRQTALMTGYTAGFAITAYVFVGVLELGAVGLVWANCLNMSARIVWNWYFIQSYLARHKEKLDIDHIRPRAASFALAAVAFAVTTQTSVAGALIWAMPYGGKLVQDVITGGVFIISLLVAERDFLAVGYTKFVGKAAN